jgi:hypothetical protein
VLIAAATAAVRVRAAMPISLFACAPIPVECVCVRTHTPSSACCPDAIRRPPPGLQTLPSLAQRRLPVGPRLRTVADRPRSGNARAPLESQIPRASRQITVKRTRTLPDRLGEADESEGEEKENEHGRARVDWRDEPRGHIQQLVHEGFLDICSKLTLEYEIDGSVDLSYERFKNSHEYDEKYKRVEYNFRRGLEQASASLCYSDQPFSAEDHAIPISKWCHFECNRNGRPGDFEVVLVVQKAGQLEKRRVRIYSRSERGKYPNATSIMDFLASVLPRVRAVSNFLLSCTATSRVVRFVIFPCPSLLPSQPESSRLAPGS